MQSLLAQVTRIPEETNIFDCSCETAVDNIFGISALVLGILIGFSLLVYTAKRHDKKPPIRGLALLISGSASFLMFDSLGYAQTAELTREGASFDSCKACPGVWGIFVENWTGLLTILLVAAVSTYVFTGLLTVIYRKVIKK